MQQLAGSISANAKRVALSLAAGLNQRMPFFHPAPMRAPPASSSSSVAHDPVIVWKLDSRSFARLSPSPAFRLHHAG